jgi:hypothetical protein
VILHCTALHPSSLSRALCDLSVSEVSKSAP